MLNVIGEVKQLKDIVNYYKDRADRAGKDASPEQVQGYLQKALKAIQKALDLLLEAHNEATDGGNYKKELKREIADCYGIMGGLYRRFALRSTSPDEARGYLTEAAKTYELGLHYEMNDSYNLFNMVVVQILLDRSYLKTGTPHIEEGVAKIQEQIKGTRRDQWWAWADLGLLYILLGNDDEATQAYRCFTRVGPRVRDYDSTLSVLNTLEKDLRTAQEPDFHVIANSIQGAIEYLETAKQRAI